MAESLYGKAELVMEYERKIFGLDKNGEKIDDKHSCYNMVRKIYTDLKSAIKNNCANGQSTRQKGKFWKFSRKNVQQNFPLYLQVLLSEYSSTSGSQVIFRKGDGNSALSVPVISIWSNYFRSIKTELMDTRHQISDLVNDDIQKLKLENAALRADIQSLRSKMEQDNADILNLLRTHLVDNQKCTTSADTKQVLSQYESQNPSQGPDINEKSHDCTDLQHTEMQSVIASNNVSDASNNVAATETPNKVQKLKQIFEVDASKGVNSHTV